MTGSREIYAVPARPEHVARFGMGFYKCRILAVFCLLLSVFCPLVSAEGISIVKSEVRLTEEGYQLAAGYDIQLNATVQQALSRGIPLYFVGEFTLTRPRWGWVDEMQQSVSRGVARYLWGDESSLSHWSWLDEDVYEGEQTIKFSYNVLTRQYRISRGALFQNFASFEDALNILSRQSSAAIPLDALENEGEYIAAARLRLDIAQLPNLLQVNALTDNNWTLDSGWHRWAVRPAGVVAR